MEIRSQQYQGDVSILKVSALPDGIDLKPMREKTVNIGESRNHHHVAVADAGSQVLFADGGDGKTYMRIVSGTATLQHLAMPTRTKADHDPITMPAGDYVFGIQYEYDELADRKVID